MVSGSFIRTLEKIITQTNVIVQLLSVQPPELELKVCSVSYKLGEKHVCVAAVVGPESVTGKLSARERVS